MKTAREKRMNALLMRGHATLTEILRADFGEWPPRGIELAVEPRHDVMLLSMWRRVKESRDKWPYLRNTLAMVSPANKNRGERKIYINPLIPHDKAASTGHEATHIMQFDHNGFFNGRFVTGADRLMAEFVDADRENTGIVMSPPAPPKAFLNLFKAMGFMKHFRKADAQYYQAGREVQARIHECMAAGYPKWKRLPATKEEFWAAMIASGVRPPPEIGAQLRATEAGRKAIGDFPALRDWQEIKYSAIRLGLAYALRGSLYGGGMGFAMTGSLPLALLGTVIGGLINAALGEMELARMTFTRAAARKFVGIATGREIGSVQRAFRKQESKPAFWRDILPRIYGDLLEMYGDAQGRARMGLGANDRLTGSWLELLRDGAGLYKKPDFDRWAQAVGKENCADTIYGIMKARLTEDKPNDLAMLASLGQVPGGRDHIRGWRDEDGSSLLCMALRCGDAGAAVMLVYAGLSFEDKGAPGGRAVADWAADYVRVAETQKNSPQGMSDAQHMVVDAIDQALRHEQAPRRAPNIARAPVPDFAPA